MRLLVDLVQLHDENRVERVDDSESEIEPTAGGLGERPQFVLAPRVLLVAEPGVFECVDNLALAFVLSTANVQASVGGALGIFDNARSILNIQYLLIAILRLNFEFC